MPFGESPFRWRSTNVVHQTCSIGWAAFPWIEEDAGAIGYEGVLKFADRGLYRAKKAGKEPGHRYDPLARMEQPRQSASSPSLIHLGKRKPAAYPPDQLASTIIETLLDFAPLHNTGHPSPPLAFALLYFPPPHARTSKMPATPLPDLVIRPATPHDIPVCADICYRAFSSINAAHNFPSDVPNPEVARRHYHIVLLCSRHSTASSPKSTAASSAATASTMRSIIHGLGPITVDPDTQNHGVGRKLMEAVLDRAQQQRRCWNPSRPGRLPQSLALALRLARLRCP